MKVSIIEYIIIFAVVLIAVLIIYFTLKLLLRFLKWIFYKIQNLFSFKSKNKNNLYSLSLCSYMTLCIVSHTSRISSELWKNYHKLSGSGIPLEITIWIPLPEWVKRIPKVWALTTSPYPCITCNKPSHPCI